MNGYRFINISSEGLPSVPDVSVTQPSCTISTGGYTITAPIATGYSTDSGSYSSATSVSNLTPGNYVVHVQNANQCFNQTSITINPQPDVAVVPTVSTVQPTCTVPTGLITVNTPLASAGYVFSIDGGAYSSSNQFTVLANTAAHTISAKRTTSVCAQSANSAAIIVQPVTLPAPGSITGINTVLPGTSQTYSISPVASAVSYLWTLPVSWTASTALDGTSVSATIGSNGGIVKVSAISADGCLSPTSNFTVSTGCRAGDSNQYPSLLFAGLTNPKSVVVNRPMETLLGNVTTGMGLRGTVGLVAKTTSNSNQFSFGYSAGAVRWSSHINWSDGNCYVDLGNAGDINRSFVNGSRLNLYKQYTFSRGNSTKTLRISGAMLMNNLAQNQNAGLAGGTFGIGVAISSPANTIGFSGNIPEFILYPEYLSLGQMNFLETSQLNFWKSY